MGLSPMNSMRFVLIAAGAGVLIAPAVATGQEVGEARAAQRVGTKLVDVYYTLAGSDGPYTVRIEGTVDGGTTWTLPVTSVSGHVGPDVTAGPNRHITWNAEADWNGLFSDRVKFRVTATRSGPPPDAAEFAQIPAGSFQMGDAMGDLHVIEWGETSAYPELPVHNVHVSEFWMGKYEVTKARWDDVRAESVAYGYTDLPIGSHFDRFNYSKGPNHPVHGINWYAMLKWCNARSEKERLTPCYTVDGAVYRTGTTSPDHVVCDWNANGYRLPTEAEWEKAARGGLSGNRFPWGNTISHNQANYRSVWTDSGGTWKPVYNYDLASTKGNHPSYADGVNPYTSPVGSFSANEYGIYDVIGNVWELCWDCYSSHYYAFSPETDPRGPGGNAGRVVRGGGWAGDALTGRVAFRSAHEPHWTLDSHFDYFSVGFRLARSAVPQ
jgi:sulfatase modifying factor 1